MLRAAIAVADRDGLDAVTMRRLGQELGVEAMSLYHHVRSKDDVIEGALEVLIGEIPETPERDDWRATIRERAMAARPIFQRHSWATAALTQREGVNAALLRHMDWTVGIMRRAGFEPAIVHSAVHVLGTRLLGFNEEAFSESPTAEGTKVLRERLAGGGYASLLEALRGLRHDDDHEFAFALDLILDALEARRDGSAAASRPDP